jgi:gas vesicle structural protein
MTPGPNERTKQLAAAKRAQAKERSQLQRDVAAARRARDRESWNARRDASRERQHQGVSRALRDRDVSLLDLVDRLLDGGVVIYGDITLAVADVDLLYVGLRAMIASVETIERDLGVSLSARGPSLESSSLEASPLRSNAFGSDSFDRDALDRDALDSDPLRSDALDSDIP